MPIFLESLPLGWPAAFACAFGFLVGLRLKRAGPVGLTLLLVSYGLVVAIVFMLPMMLGDCRTDTGRMLISMQVYAAFGLSWLAACGGGMLAARVWKLSRTVGALAIIGFALASIPLSYLAVFASAFKPGCFL